MAIFGSDAELDLGKNAFANCPLKHFSAPEANLFISYKENPFTGCNNIQRFECNSIEWRRRTDEFIEWLRTIPELIIHDSECIAKFEDLGFNNIRSR